MKQIILLSWLLSLWNSAESQYFNSEIKKICSDSRLQIIKKQTYEQIENAEIIVKKTSIRYHILRQNTTVTHIGITIFSDSMLLGSNSLIYKFIERKLLLYVLSNNPDSIKDDLNYSNAFLSYNNIRYGEPGFLDYAKSFDVFNSHAGYTLYSDSEKIFIKIMGSTSMIIFGFKKSYYTIAGLNKVEADSFLFNEINLDRRKDNTNSNSNKIIADLQKINDSIFEVRGANYLQTLSSNYYIIKFGNSVHNVFDPNYPSKSFISSIVNPNIAQKNIIVLLEHRQYKKKKEILINLTTLVNFLKQDHELYFGIEDSSSTLSGTLIAYNKDLNYIHMLYFVTSQFALFGPNPEYLCKLYSFIPTDNIEDIFADKHKIKKQVKTTK